jgi:ubiquinone/menaquinone biosynthesis C-methylase UbiE
VNLDLLERLRCPFTGGPFRVEAVEQVGDDLRHGVLHSEIGEYPVVAGIPILRRDLDGMDAVIEHLRAGDPDAAARRAAFGQIPPSGLGRLGGWLADTQRLRGLGRRADARHHARLDERARPLTEPTSGAQELFDLAYHQLHLRNPEVYEYNWHRFALPRQLAALAVAEWAPRRGPVLDVACGAGHLTWALGRALDVPVVGVDGLFFALYVARTRIAPDAELLCVDLESLPFPDGEFGGIWASDVLHALRRKVQTVRELDRVARPDAWGAAIWLAIKDTEHHQPARPLTLDGYRRLLPDGTTFLAGETVLEHYLDGHAADRSDPGDLATSATATALWDAGGDARDGRPFDGWPHARGDLGVNTLFEDDGTGELRLRLPTEEFAREHDAVRRYTPATARRDDDEARLVEQFVLLGYPDGYA